MALPEVLIRAEQMNDQLKAKKVQHLQLQKCDHLIKYGFMNLHEVDVSNRTIQAISGKGYWIYVELDADMVLLLGEISGKILYHASRESVPDVFHLKLDFADDSFLTVRIAGWGFAKAVKKNELASHRYPGKLGLSPIDEKAFTFQSFFDVLERHGNKMVKYVLLRQEEIAGIGNLYLQDILYQAGVHPKRKAKDIDEDERRNLYSTIRDTMQEAMRLGGSECDLYNNPGGYERIVGKHLKDKPCPECGTTIEKLNVLGSAAYVCPSCQK